jgi:hypothetical protein
MARNWLFGRAKEATTQELIASGAAGAYGVDPIDGDRGFVQLGTSGLDQPKWTTDKQRAYSIAGYRSNPMARAIIDTYTSFCVGDSGCAPESDDPDVRVVADEFWNDPRNKIGHHQPLLCRDWLLMGEQIWEYLVGPTTGIVRFSPISPSTVTGVELDRGNPLWLDQLHVLRRDRPLQIVRMDDFSGLRVGEVGYFPSWRALITDRRGTPFLAPALDDLDAYATVLSNLVDRTALARYIAMEVVVDGDQTEVDAYVKQRGGMHIPRSGTIEAHNKKIEIKPLNIQSGSFEDTNTALSVLTNVASASGLAKTWLAESEGANRATSMSMAEPVRRRVGGVQNEWLEIQTEHVRYAIDRAVEVGRLPRMLPRTDVDGRTEMVAPSQLVRVTGPKIAAADAQITATVMMNLATAITSMVDSKVLTQAAGAIAVQKAWEQFVGRPFPPALAAKPAVTLSPEQTAEEIALATAEGQLFLVS